MVQGSLPDLTELQVERFCQDLRAGLDNLLLGNLPARSIHHDDCPKALSEAEESGGTRRLAGGPVVLGDLSQEATDNGCSVAGSLQV
eukprot:scaffold78038_cov35-Prasinocladus_malaysianus.AAC.1